MNQLTIYARSVLRRFGILQKVACWHSAMKHALGWKNHYEGAVSKALLTAARPGDCVWDIGANKGLYTVLLGVSVGPNGCVHAFEPAPACFNALKQEIARRGLTNVRAHNLALAVKSGQLELRVDEDPLAATHRIVNETSRKTPTVTIEAVSGDEFCRHEGLAPPAVVKIDVEGFELEVLQGLETTLKDSSCRTVVCEVHFAILEANGQAFAPMIIEKFLKKCGFDQLRWLDFSHLCATKTLAHP